MTAKAATYVGRFAPSPSGPLHLGSAAAALASYLDAKAHGGRWLLRIEDVDTARTVAGAADCIVDQLRWLGMGWDGPVVQQSRRGERYREAFAATLKQHAIGSFRPFCCNAFLVRTIDR